VRGNVVHHAGTGIYPDVRADRLTVERNVLYGNENAVSGVQPRRIVVRANYWDDAEPYWWPLDTPTHGVRLGGNALLPPGDPVAACRADDACADILTAAGPRADQDER
jgi:hypothetical protein